MPGGTKNPEVSRPKGWRTVDLRRVILVENERFTQDRVDES